MEMLANENGPNRGSWGRHSSDAMGRSHPVVLVKLPEPHWFRRFIQID